MFEIDFKSRRSIYEQVVDNMKERILVGVLGPGEKLPSVRDLSKMLTVNPNTVQKAFRELEKQGYIYSVAGVGTFASPVEDIRADERLIAAARAALADVLRELCFLTRDVGAVRRMANEELAGLPGGGGAVPGGQAAGKGRTEDGLRDGRGKSKGAKSGAKKGGGEND